MLQANLNVHCPIHSQAFIFLLFEGLMLIVIDCLKIYQVPQLSRLNLKTCLSYCFDLFFLNSCNFTLLLFYLLLFIIINYNFIF